MDKDEIVTPINVRKLSEHLRASKYPTDKARKLIQGFTEGFDLGYRGPKIRRDTSQNIPITVGSNLEMWQKMMKEVKLHRYAGPFEQIPYDNFIQSPVGLVPKDNGTKTCLIFHLSYYFKRLVDGKLRPQQNSVNFYTPKDLCTVRYKDLDCAIRSCLKLLKQFENGLWDNLLIGDNSKGNKVIYYSKTDVVSAFRVLPILPGHCIS